MLAVFRNFAERSSGLVISTPSKGAAKFAVESTHSVSQRSDSLGSGKDIRSDATYLQEYENLADQEAAYEAKAGRHEKKAKLSNNPIVIAYHLAKATRAHHDRSHVFIAKHNLHRAGAQDDVVEHLSGYASGFRPGEGGPGSQPL